MHERNGTKEGADLLKQAAFALFLLQWPQGVAQELEAVCNGRGIFWPATQAQVMRFTFSQ